MQDQIGWFELMHGKLAIQLVRIQERYSFTNNEGLDGKSWSTDIVKQLLDSPIPSGCTAISHSIIRRWDTYIG